MTNKESIADAIRRLRLHQMPWGEWTAVGESARSRFKRTRRGEYIDTPLPKHNTFRTVVAAEALRRASSKSFSSDCQRVDTWLTKRLNPDPKKFGGHNSGMWLAPRLEHVGTGMGGHGNAFVAFRDLRHTAQGWMSLLFRGVECNTEHLRVAIKTIEDNYGRTSDQTLWSSIEGGIMPPDLLASACCIALLRQCATRNLLDSHPNRTGFPTGVEDWPWSRHLLDLLRANLSLTGKTERLEHASRSLWVLAHTGFKVDEETGARILETLEQAPSADLGSFQAKIRLCSTARALSLNHSIDDQALCDDYRRFSETMIPTDFAFFLLSLRDLTYESLPHSGQESPTYKSIIYSALRERLVSLRCVILRRDTIDYNDVWEDEQRACVHGLLQVIDEGTSRFRKRNLTDLENVDSLIDDITNAAITKRIALVDRPQNETSVQSPKEKAVLAWESGEVAVEGNCLIWFDQRFDFEDSEMLEAVWVFLEAWLGGSLPISLDHIRKKTNSKLRRLGDMFRHADKSYHRIWDEDWIRRAAKGKGVRYTLQTPDERRAATKPPQSEAGRDADSQVSRS